MEELGFIPDDTDSDDASRDMDTEDAPEGEIEEHSSTDIRESFGVPWFEDLVEGTRLGRLRRRHGASRSKDGKMQVEWEIIEYSDNGNDGQDVEMATPASGKRKLDERDDNEVATH